MTRDILIVVMVVVLLLTGGCAMMNRHAEDQTVTGSESKDWALGIAIAAGLTVITLMAVTDGG